MAGDKHAWQEVNIRGRNVHMAGGKHVKQKTIHVWQKVSTHSRMYVSMCVMYMYVNMCVSM